jgi:Tfp pilus assembly protein PilF
MANRYAYISLIGIFIIATWGVPDLLKRFYGRRYLPVVSVAVIIAFAFCAKSALPDWKNSEAAFRQALNVTKNNHIAEIGMGNVWLGRGDLPKARSHYLESLRIKPDYPEAMINLGIVYMKQGLFEDAIAQYGKALEASPTDVKILNNLGVALACKGRHEEAVIRFREALRRSPGYQEASDNLAKVMMELKGSVRP